MTDKEYYTKKAFEALDSYNIEVLKSDRVKSVRFRKHKKGFVEVLLDFDNDQTIVEKIKERTNYEV